MGAKEHDRLILYEVRPRWSIRRLILYGVRPRWSIRPTVVYVTGQ